MVLVVVIMYNSFRMNGVIPYPYLRFLSPAHGIREADGPGGPKRHALIMIPMISDQ